MQRLEQAGVNIKGAILNGVIKRASTAYSYGYNYYGYSYSRKSKTEGKVTGCGVNAFSGLRIRQFFVCHQPQSIQVAECSFYTLQTARRYACFIHDLRKTGQRTHALRISLFTSCRGQFHLSGRRI